MSITMLLIILLVVVVVCAFGANQYGMAGWSPLGLVLLVLLILWLTGRIG